MPDLRSDLTEAQLEMEKKLKPHGFFIEFEYHSTLFRKNLTFYIKGTYIYISSEDGVTLPKSFDEPIIIGLYHSDGRQLGSPIFGMTMTTYFRHLDCRRGATDKTKERRLNK